MAVDVARTQDVYKAAGQSVNFTTLLLNRKDRDAELEVIQDMADRIQAIKRSVSIRANGEGLGIAFGFSRKAWDYLFPNAPVPKELEDFQGIKGDKQDVPAVAADLFLHVRSNNESVTYTVVDQIMEFLRPVTSVVDETHGFHYEQGRAIIDFVDGTENPVGQEAVEWGVIGDEDPEFTNGSYAFAQKYEHDLDAWRALPTEMQEKFIGRRKFSDIELEDDEKDPAAHNVVAQDNRDDEEHKIVRMNVPFAQPGQGVRGTYFIGYARYWDVTKTMLTNMFTQNDKLLDYSKPITGMLFFIPSLDTLDAIAEGEL